jgi:hypothetical protein
MIPKLANLAKLGIVLKRAGIARGLWPESA